MFPSNSTGMPLLIAVKHLIVTKILWFLCTTDSYMDCSLFTIANLVGQVKKKVDKSKTLSI